MSNTEQQVGDHAPKDETERQGGRENMLEGQARWYRGKLEAQDLQGRRKGPKWVIRKDNGLKQRSW